MKKFIAVCTAAVLCAVMFCSCGSASSIAKKAVNAVYVDFDDSVLEEYSIYNEDLLGEYVKNSEVDTYLDMLDSIINSAEKTFESSEDRRDGETPKVTKLKEMTYKDGDKTFDDYYDDLKNIDKELAKDLKQVSISYYYLSAEYEDEDGEEQLQHSVKEIVCVKIGGSWYLFDF